MWSGERVTVGRFVGVRNFAVEENFNVNRETPSIITQRWRGHVLFRYVSKKSTRRNVSVKMVHTILDDKTEGDLDSMPATPAVEIDRTTVAVAAKPG